MSLRLKRAVLFPVLAAVLVALWAVGCGGPVDRIAELQKKYNLSDGEAAEWRSLHVEDAESLAVALWSHIGHGEFDAAMYMVKRFGSPQLEEMFNQRITNLWSHVITMPAVDFLKEPQMKLLGDGTTVGFRTWGELFAGGFQRAVLADDSVTVYFIFNGYWQTHAMPLYAAVQVGDFGTEQTSWRPFAHLIFSMDASKETIASTGKAQYRRTLDAFVKYLRTRKAGETPDEKH